MDTLINQAKKDGIDFILVGAIINKGDRILMLKRSGADKKPHLYEVPNHYIKEDETLSNALKRVVIEQTNLEIKEVKQYLFYTDWSENQKKFRQFNFLVDAYDEYEILVREHVGYAWVLPKEGVGYPIDSKNMEILDHYDSLKRS